MLCKSYSEELDCNQDKALLLRASSSERHLSSNYMNCICKKDRDNISRRLKSLAEEEKFSRSYLFKALIKQGALFVASRVIKRLVKIEFSCRINCKKIEAQSSSTTKQRGQN